LLLTVVVVVVVEEVEEHVVVGGVDFALLTGVVIVTASIGFLSFFVVSVGQLVYDFLQYAVRSII